MSSRAKHIHSKPTRKVGFVLKPHGYGGQLRISLEDDYLPDDFLFLEINRKFVPFPIESFNEEAGIIKLQGYDSLDQVSELVNLPVLELLGETPESDHPDLNGYTLKDLSSGKEFDVTGIVEYPGNLLIEFRNGYKDALLPLHEDIIREIDHENKIITAEFPEGLLEL